MRLGMNVNAGRSGNGELLTAELQYVLPLSQLSAGPYLLRFEARRAGTTHMREVRFGVR